MENKTNETSKTRTLEDKIISKLDALEEKTLKSIDRSYETGGPEAMAMGCVSLLSGGLIAKAVHVAAQAKTHEEALVGGLLTAGAILYGVALTAIGGGYIVKEAKKDALKKQEAALKAQGYIITRE